MDGADEELLGTSTLRGILLLSGVVAVAYISYRFWYRQKKLEIAAPVRRAPIRVPLDLPVARK